MTEAIDTLVGQFESRRLTRRQLVQALTALGQAPGPRRVRRRRFGPTR